MQLYLETDDIIRTATVKTISGIIKWPDEASCLYMTTSLNRSNDQEEVDDISSHLYDRKAWAYRHFAKLMSQYY